MRTRLLILGLMLAGAAAVGWTTRHMRSARDAAAVERSLLRMRALEEAGLRGQASAAGISLQRPEVVPLDERRLGSLTDDADFHAFRHRCRSCHESPDPSMHTPAEWPAVVERMNGWMQKAGVIALDAQERAAVARFLVRAAARSR